MFRMKDDLLSISLQVTTIPGLCLMPGFRFSHSRLYYVLAVKAPSFRPAGLKPDITLQWRPRSDGSVFNVATTDASGKELSAASLATPTSSVSITALAKHVQRVREKPGHVDLKRIFMFKRHGKVVCANLSSKFLKPYRQACPICLATATKRRRRGLPKSVDNKTSLALLNPWEVTHLDVSGHWRVPSSRSNRYYSLFVCGKRGTKLLVPHRKKTGAQQAYVKFITRIGSHPKTLFTDFCGEICSNQFDHFLLANGVQHVVSTLSPLPLSMSLPRPSLRRLTVSLQTMMPFLRLGAMLSGSSRNSIARISGLVSLTSPVFSLAIRYLQHHLRCGALCREGSRDAAADNAALDDAVQVDLQDSSSAPNPPFYLRAAISDAVLLHILQILKSDTMRIVANLRRKV
jgi:hypothetical protein